MNVTCIRSTGNPDIAGIGVLVSLGVEGVLATIGGLGTVGLRMVYSWDSEKHLLSDRYPSARSHYIALKSFLLAFIDSAMFFSLSIQAAGLVYVLSRLEGYREAAMCLYAGLFSLFPIYLALFVVWTDLRRPVYRLGMLMFIVTTCGALSIVVMVKYFRGDPALRTDECFREERKNSVFLVLSCSLFWALTFSASSLVIAPMLHQHQKHASQVLWSIPIFRLYRGHMSSPGVGASLGLISRLVAAVVQRMEAALSGGVSFLLVTLGAGIIGILAATERVNRILVVPPQMSSLEIAGMALRLVGMIGGARDPQTIIRLLGISIALFGMWVEYVLLVLSRDSRTAQDDGYQENIMGYGQVLALLLWVPVMVEYFYVYFCMESRSGFSTWAGRTPT